MITKEQAIEVLKKVEDPELAIDVWTLGLIYAIETKEEGIDIKMTFTSPLCPYGPMLVDDIKRRLTELGAKTVHVEIVVTPPWEPSEHVKELLGI